MDAKTAREKADYINSLNKNKEYNEIKNHILKACEEGKYFLYIYHKVSKSVIEKLELEGFKIESQTYNNGCDTKISW